MNDSSHRHGERVATEGRAGRRQDDLVIEVIQAHASSLLRVARRYSYCADDAQDAYQRALEIFIRRAATLEPDGMAAWLRTVVKHEALAVRAARGRQMAGTDIDFDAREDRRLPSEDERIESFELLERSAEALTRLKPQEVRALLLKAQGHSYQEICELTGWSYTKVNRCLAEGRRSFLDRMSDIESGRECERWGPLLSSLADGEASAKDVARLRPHLRHCPGCRARLGQYRQHPGHVAVLVPVAAFTPGGGRGDAAAGLLVRLYETVTGGLHERAVLSAQKISATVEAATTGKAAAVAASAAALAGGGVAATRTPMKAADAARPAKHATHDGAAASAAAKPRVATTPRITVAALRSSGSSTKQQAQKTSTAADRTTTTSEFVPEKASKDVRQSSKPETKPATKGPAEFEP